MRGLERIPGIDELARAYDRLRGDGADEGELSLGSQWARLDPRLAELWVACLARRWGALNPVALRSALLAQPWPASAGVLLEFAGRLVLARERRLFARWRDVVLESVPLAGGEQFFIGQRAVGGKEMFLDAAFPLAEYARWGYLSREVPINKAPPAWFRRDRETRARILDSLLGANCRITVRQYLEAVGEGISLRQAERDLTGCRRLRAEGNTRARYYRVVGKSR